MGTKLLILIATTANASHFAGTFSRPNASALKSLERPGQCALFLTAARLEFLNDNPRFEEDPAAMAVFADRLQENGVSYGDYLSWYASGKRHEANGMFDKNSLEWFPSYITALADSYYFDSSNGRVRGLGFNSWSRLLDFADGEIRPVGSRSGPGGFFQKLGMDTIYVHGDRPLITVASRNASMSNLATVIENLTKASGLKRVTIEAQLGSPDPTALLDVLSKSPNFKANIEHMGLRNWTFVPRVVPLQRVKALLKGMTNLTSLDFSNSNVTLAILRELSHLRGVTHLDFGDSLLEDGGGLTTMLDDRAARILSKMTQLESLNLEGHVMRLSGIQHLARLPNLTSLRFQHYWGDTAVLGAAELRALSTGFPRLKTLTLGNRGAIDAHNLEALRKARPELKIIFDNAGDGQ